MWPDFRLLSDVGKQRSCRLRGSKVKKTLHYCLILPSIKNSFSHIFSLVDNTHLNIKTQKRNPDFDVRSPWAIRPHAFPGSLLKRCDIKKKRNSSVGKRVTKKLSSYPSFLRVLSMFLMFGDLTAVSLETTQEHTSTRVHPCGIACSWEQQSLLDDTYW